MNLLLLLSALLSALTGVVGGAQRLEAAPALARSLEQPAARATAAASFLRPLFALPVLAAVAREAVQAPVLAVPRAPLWWNRRRE